MRLFLALLLPLALSADQITATLINQTPSTSVTAGTSAGATCSDVGTTSATCISTDLFGDSGGAGAFINVGYSGAGLSVYAGGSGNGLGYGVAQATLTGTVLITGGVGIGYLDIGAAFAGNLAAVHNANATVNSQSLTLLDGGAPLQLIPFTFGQPIDYSLSLYAQGDNQSNGDVLSLVIAEAYVYEDQPARCGVDGCDDPNYVNVTSVFMGEVGNSVSGSINSAPEPATIWIAGLGLSALLLSRRVARGYTRVNRHP